MFVRSGFPFNYDASKVSKDAGLKCVDRSLAQQSAADECDINTIVKRFHLTGQLPENVRVPSYSDFEGVFDFQSAMNAIVEAERSFMKMPADTRARFLNDPQRFVAFCSDEKNLEEMRKLGLAVPKEEPVVPAPVVPDAVVAPVAKPEAPVSKV
jgi:phage internal scaffolding protein